MNVREQEQARRDARLQASIVAELDWHALIDSSQLAVTVDHDVVTIVGTVPSVAQKLVVLDTVESVEGVHDIVSEIDVKLPAASSRPDAELRVAVDQVLTWDALVPEQDLTHQVLDGWVTLRGTVPTARQRLEAERLVSHLLGVRGVTNEIAVAELPLDPATVRAALETALMRHAKHAANHIDLVVEGSHVTLTGSVESGREKRAVIGAVSHAPGVEALCAELTVRPKEYDETAFVG
ncbi:MAG: BON domain-containing protein [Acidimicrobiales bacterium]